ncbi:unnamed protein product [Laminaria digitata]
MGVELPMARVAAMHGRGVTHGTRGGSTKPTCTTVITGFFWLWLAPRPQQQQLQHNLGFRVEREKEEDRLGYKNIATYHPYAYLVHASRAIHDGKCTPGATTINAAGSCLRPLLSMASADNMELPHILVDGG